VSEDRYLGAGATDRSEILHNARYRSRTGLPPLEGTEKLELWVYRLVKKCENMFTSFDRIHERDGQTDTARWHKHSIAR